MAGWTELGAVVGGVANGHRRLPDLGAAADALTGWAVVGLVGMFAGICLHLSLRSMGARWSWASPVVAIGVALGSVSSQVAVLVGIAGLTAISIGFAWEREALERGGEEAQLERDRTGVLSAVIARRERQRARAQRVTGTRFALGVARSGKPATVPFGSEQGVRALIVGAPGTGKTVTTAAIVGAYIDQGLPVVCVDPKGDPSLREHLAMAAGRRKTRLIEWTPDGGSIYNPLSRGDATEIADKALAGEHWSEPHYLRQAQRYLGWELRVLSEVGVPISLSSLVAHMEPDALEALGDRCEPTMADGLRRYLDSLSARQRTELGGVRDRLAVLGESRLGRWLDPQDGASVDVAETWQDRHILYFRLDADRYPLASQMLGASIVSDLVSLTGELQRERPALGLVAIDEFAAVGARQILRVLSRSRSAGISVLLATQGIADLYDVDAEGGSAESFSRRVLTQLNFVVAHRQPESASAETLAGVAGTRAAWRTTRRVYGGLRASGGERVGSRTREREYVCHPDEFKSLAVGEAIVIEPGSKQAASRVTVWPSADGWRLKIRGVRA